jgi:hypothetical protein
MLEVRGKGAAMNVWYVEVKRARDDGSEEISKVGYLHEPTRADLDELEAENWVVGLVGQQTLAATRLGSPRSDPAILRAHATVIAAFLDGEMDACLDDGKQPPTAALQEAKAICAAADDAGLTELAMGLQRLIEQAERQIAERRGGAR